MKTLRLERSNLTLFPDRRRVLIRPFHVGIERALKISARVLVLSESEVRTLLAQVMAQFDDRHLRIHDFLRSRFEQLRNWLPAGKELSKERELLLGAYFSHEYSFEAAALFNPSIVPHPDQEGLPKDSLRFVMSLRATGEGHISSITFRTGIVDAGRGISVHEPTRHNLEPDQTPSASYDKGIFDRKLKELGLVS